MNKKEMMKQINIFLNKQGCQDILFYAPKDARFLVKENYRVIKDLFKISFKNKNMQNINIFLKFNPNSYIYRASNEDTISYLMELSDDDKNNIDEILNLYSGRDDNIGFEKMEFSLQSSPVRFLNTLDEFEINIYVEILKYPNMIKQTCSITKIMFFDIFGHFMRDFLPLFV